ncbi:MAG: membrane-bound lytic murein transglycosylase MltF [Gammaproteobacteria bacterium]
MERIRIPILGLLLLLLTACGEKPLSQLEEVRARGELVVVTRNAGTTYFTGASGPTGFEYELARRFAKHLGVGLRMEVPERFPDVLKRVEAGTADLAAAGLSVTKKRLQRVRFGPSYHHIRQQIIYRSGRTRPRQVEHLMDGQLEIIAGSSHEETLLRLRHNGYPKLAWKAHEDEDSETLMRWVSEELIDFTVADSDEAAVARLSYPDLRVGFNLTKPEPLAWAFSKDRDDSLFDEAGVFFAQLRESGELNHLIRDYYGFLLRFNLVTAKTFSLDYRLRLPRYRGAFEHYARENGLDWKLLAALGYQESRWDPSAVSPTGVKGLMMLTQGTARMMGIEDREDPIQSIDGGARYLVRVKNKIPERIPEPDRTWFALASYNVGYGHLEDARILTQKGGGNPDRWDDVAKWLPRLAERKWYTQTRYGYARGGEPVVYVDRIRRYLNLLNWLVSRESGPEQPPRPSALDAVPSSL